MTFRPLIASVLVALVLTACGEDKIASLPTPHEPGPSAIGTVCRMSLSEHSGPKGQVFVKSQDAPLWFSSVRDTFTWLLVDEGAGKNFAAIYVNDMARASNWEKPDAGAWVEARDAYYVVGSSKGVDMGGSELVPFSERASADAFVRAHGGTVVGFEKITRDLLMKTDLPAHVGGGHHG